MSVSNLFTPNNFELFTKSLDVVDLISEALQTNDINATLGTIGTLQSTTSTIGSVISDKITQTTGFNYLSPWSATKSYIVGDLVISSGFIWKCLVANTNIQPDPNTPSQTQWAQTTSNNAILNNAQYVQLNSVVGDDAKALVSATPFKTVGAALNYLKSKSGGVAKIMSINQTYSWGSPWTAYDNIVIDGGDESDDIQSNPTNTLDAYVILSNCNGFTIKNCTWLKTAGGEIIGSNGGTDNLTLQNIKFIDPPGGGVCVITISGTPSTPFGSHSFINCWQTVVDSAGASLIIAGQAKAGCIILIDNAGLTSKSTWGINNTFGGGVTNGADLTLICRDSYINTGSFVHTNGSTMIFNNCIFSGGNTFTSTASSGSLVLNNCSFFDPLTNTWCAVNINMTGTANLLMVDCLTNPNSTTDVIQFTTPTSAVISSGPASRMNRLAVLTTTPQLAQTLTTGAAVELLVPSITTNQFNIASYNAGRFRFLCNGVYNVFFTVELSNTSTANEQTAFNAWIGPVGSTEASGAVSQSTFTRLLGSAGQVALFPTSRIPVFFSVIVNGAPNLNVDMTFYARCLGSVNGSGRIFSCNIVQLR